MRAAHGRPPPRLSRSTEPTPGPTPSRQSVRRTSMPSRERQFVPRARHAPPPQRLHGLLGVLHTLGVEVKSGLTLTSAQRRYLEVLESRLGFSLTATSGDRSPESQADAMLAKYRAKGAGELRTVYRQHAGVIDALLAAPKTREAWAKIIREKGSRLSRHLWSGAVDVRTRDLSAEGLKALKKAVTDTGGRPYLEYDHLHIDLPSGYAAQSGSEVVLKTSARGWVTGWAVAGLLALGAIGIRAWKQRAA